MPRGLSSQRPGNGPAPGAKDGSGTIDSRTDQLQAEMARGSPAQQAQHNVGDGGDAEAYAVHKHLATRSKGPSDSHQADRAEHSNDDGDLETDRIANMVPSGSNGPT
jgi:hypothetical protein